MCDFRPLPHAVQEVETGKIIFYGGCPSINATGTKYDNGMLMKEEVRVPGLYFLCATGSAPSYFDGKNWYGDFSWYEDHEYWQDKMDQLGPNDKKYRFLRDEICPTSSQS